LVVDDYRFFTPAIDLLLRPIDLLSLLF
jgi:hypothetical protein